MPLSHLCQNISYGKEQHPQGNHLHQWQGGGSLRQANTGEDEKKTIEKQIEEFFVNLYSSNLHL